MGSIAFIFYALYDKEMNMDWELFFAIGNCIFFILFLIVMSIKMNNDFKDDK